jgi:hypothetical protein
VSRSPPSMSLLSRQYCTRNLDSSAPSCHHDCVMLLCHSISPSPPYKKNNAGYPATWTKHAQPPPCTARQCGTVRPSSASCDRYFVTLIVHAVSDSRVTDLSRPSCAVLASISSIRLRAILIKMGTAITAVRAEVPIATRADTQAAFPVDQSLPRLLAAPLVLHSKE